MGLSVHDIYRRTFRLWRAQRLILFLKRLELRHSDRVLDVGGVPVFWASTSKDVARVDILNLGEVVRRRNDVGRDRCRHIVVGDACAAPFRERSYDVVFSNSVIEHVGSWQRQKAFAAEVRRLADRIWIQTPAYECPIEPHYLAPFVHYLPRSVQTHLLRWATPWGILQRPTPREVENAVHTTRLLRKREMEELFPDCEIVTEWLAKWARIPKSYIAIRAAAACEAAVPRGPATGATVPEGPSL